MSRVMELCDLMLVMTEESINAPDPAEIDCNWYNKVTTFNLIPDETQFSHTVSRAFHHMDTNDSKKYLPRNKDIWVQGN